MAYPKPLSEKSIKKLLEPWEPHTVEVLHTYYEAFARLYGVIQLKDAWKIFKNFEPKIHKKQFIEFSNIARRENVPYYVFEINELYSEEKPIDTERYIVNKTIISPGYGKYSSFYVLEEYQYGKPFYSGSDLLEVAAHRLYDKELREFVDNLTFTKGEHAGKRFADTVIITEIEQSLIDHYSKMPSKAKEIYDKANVTVAEKFMNVMTNWIEFSIGSSFSMIEDFMDNIGFEFQSKEQVDEFFSLIQDFQNKSHLWANRGFTPQELYRAMAKEHGQRPQIISFGPGIRKAILDGDIDRQELIEQIKAMGFDVEDQ